VISVATAAAAKQAEEEAAAATATAAKQAHFIVETLVIGGIDVESTMTEADFSGKSLKEAEVIALAAFLPKCR
jgi:GH25 family lysozyme M1 (1,4-beta-N-acetylmuramidase)